MLDLWQQDVLLKHTEQKKMKRNAASLATRHTTNQAYRIEENEKNAASMATRCTTNKAYRIEENERNAASMATRRTTN